ncbi:helicase RepA family protein [Pseudomonas rubra]|uniref:Helicase RepA family protein n=1 Tax=Pseudomonas rubra TaxID=2942627 RepID=A0ABT5PF60_9PSED|nr:helicase RepA family protein [Pseudomonas rubra]MDD1016948.1 helicase RepA family protein [Pseudomonas rubra]MDD1041055.1 helicase RepA family protein [Pseudomonas rubra]MDD1157482.1 helicase RepA family protein [Pseudomonas rubra]
MPIDLRSVFVTPPPALDYVFGSFVAGTVGAFVAPGGTGKSFWALQTAIAVACHVPEGNLAGIAPPSNGPVLYLALEDSEQVLAHRIHAIGRCIRKRSKYPDDAAEALDAIAANLMIEPMMGKRLDVMTDKGMEAVLKLQEAPRLIVLDTVSRIHGLDENSNRDMSLLISRLEELATKSGAAVLLIHHVSKASRRDGQLDQYSSRGASALIDNARWCGYLTQMTEDEAKRLIEGSRFSTPLTGLHSQYVRLGESKLNYGSAVLEQQWFKRSEGGVLLPALISEAKSRATSMRPRKGREAANAV